MSKDREQELGTLVIVVLKARNLNNKYFWKQDVFAQVSLNGTPKRTQVEVKGGQHPMWDEEIRVPVMKDSAEKYRKLEVSCWAKESRKEENIGQGHIDLTETLKTGEFDDWISLESNGVVRGDIYLEMTFYTNAPAPPGGGGLSVPQANSGLMRRPSKLSPADRLARPPYTSPPNSHAHRPDQPPYGQSNGLNASTTPSGGRQSPLPPLPEQQSTNDPVPSTLTPGRPARPQGGQGLPQHVPSILR
ncbi:C2 domain-containing protein, partial [Mycena rebaudengoi]